MTESLSGSGGGGGSSGGGGERGGRNRGTGPGRWQRARRRLQQTGPPSPWAEPPVVDGDLALSAAVRNAARVLITLLIVGGVVLAFTTEQGLPGSPFFTIAALVAAPFVSTLETALTGLASAGALTALLLLNHTTDREDDFTRIATVASVGVLAVGINRLLLRMNAALTSARTIAETAQLAVLPIPPTRIGGLRIAVRYEAAQSDAHIGGDLYAVHKVPQGIRMIVGDVRGKGIEAVRTVAVVVGTFREAAEQEATLEAVACRLDRAMRRETQGRQDPYAHEDFATALLAEIPVGDSEVLRLVNRGHPPPLLLAAGGAEFVHPAEPTLPLGLADLSDPGARPDSGDEIPFRAGMRVLLYTDGLSEARDRSGTFFDPRGALAGRDFSGPEALLDTVLTEVGEHVGGDLKDDLALVAVERRAAVN
ncbi:PP2C family protein-serine/threonine phosphatase [Streptomyces sp. Amel2xB2]|uniref:PP2C family protein-serine/threonine phosphatase n=1 Tax=Streptomyces sp. Amel2xB2 TaxID=1305829 RepID=UPI0011B93549|nr:PP2C family protein-serine/threonine phosphatase [Streptomyces sp. Amel2xB2]